MTPEQRLLTYRDVTRMLAVSLSTVHRLIERGDLPKLRVGGCVRFRPEDVEALIQNDNGGSHHKSRRLSSQPAEGTGEEPPSTVKAGRCVPT